MELTALLVSLGASAIGAICGVGGGIIIKPVLDATGALAVGQVNFLAGCTVLAMTAYAVARGLLGGAVERDLSRDVPLAVGAALGGLAGRWLVRLVEALVGAPEVVGAVQAGVLALVTLGTLLYTVFKDRVRTRSVTGMGPCLAIGLGLGACSSFLGIGGGPINLVALFYFFSLPTKRAAASSLFIILCSQATATGATLVDGAPAVPFSMLAVMIAAGILGAAVGRRVNRRLSGPTVDKLFIALMAAIIVICLGNLGKFVGVLG